MASGAAPDFEPYLLAGESILWSGKPGAAGGMAARVVAFCAVAGLAIVHRALGAAGGPLAALLERNAFVLAAMALGIAAESIVYRSWLASTAYAITSQRVLIVSGLREKQLVEIFIARLNRARITVRLRGRVIELSGLAAGRGAPLPYLPFTNPSVAPQWFVRGEFYRLVGLEEVKTPYETIIEAARSLG